MCIELTNKTTQFPKGIAENVMVKINKFVFLVDFLILDMEEDHRIPSILGRPFLATAHVMIDVFNKKISFEVGDEIITFDLEKSMKFPPSNEDSCHAADIIDLSILHESYKYDDNSTLFIINSIDDEKTTPKLKELPSHLEYAFWTTTVNYQSSSLRYYLIRKKDSPWVSPNHVVPNKGGTTVIANKDNELVPTRTNEYYCFLDGFSGYFQIPLAPEDQEKTTFT
ncbi:DNA-directed DNA polymerase, partial [Tanacetum coccineum]